MCVVRSRELNYVNYYVMVFRNVCFELEFVIRDVILVKDNSCRYEFMTYDLCHSSRGGHVNLLRRNKTTWTGTH